MTSAATCFNFNGNNNAKYIIQGINSSGAPLRIELGQDDERSLLLAWLCDINAWDHHKDVCARQILDKDTGGWLLSSDGPAAATFKQWKDALHTESDRKLWAYGHPGIGKTVAASRMIEDLIRMRDAHTKQRIDAKPDGVCWSYISKVKELDRNQLPGHILRSIMRTLAESQPGVLRLVREIYRQHTQRESTSPDNNNMVCYISQLCLERFERVYIVIDGLDEASERDRHELVTLLNKLPANTRIAYLSRYMEDIKESIGSKLTMVICTHDMDVRLFVKGRLREEVRFQKIIEDATATNKEIVPQIENAMIERARHSFLAARLCMDMLQAAKTAQELRETLASLPQSPRDVYQALFRRIKDSSDQKDRLWAKRIVTWACFARETFDTAEIRYMTGLNPEDPNLYHDNLLPDTQITSLCAGLVVVESASRKVSLVHTEAQKHFQAHEMRYLPEAHIDIATGCVAHIHAFAKEKALDDLIELEFIEGAWKFLAYSIRHLSHHIDAHIKNTDAHIKNNGALHRSERRLTSESLTYSGGAATDPNYVTLRRAALDKRTRILCESIVGLLQSNKTFNLILRAIVHMDLYPAKAALYSTPLHVAVILGLFDAVKFIGLDKATLDRTDGLENTALTLAITHGHVDIAEFLIRQGCLVGLDSINGRRVFELAVHRKNLDIAKRMIDAAAAPEKPDRIWRVKSASKNKAIEFLNAALSGDLATVRILCKGDKLSQMKSTALLVATDRGYLDMVRNLLDSGADVNSRDLERRTALHRAVIRHDITMTTLLLDRRAKIDATDMSSDSPLTLAMRDAGNRPIFELLLERHADVNLADYLGQSMLYCAAACGNTAMVRRLLEAGAEPSIRTRFYWTPLHWAAGNGHYDSTEALLAKGANPNAVSDAAQTPLETVLRSGAHNKHIMLGITSISTATISEEVTMETIVAVSSQTLCSSCNKFLSLNDVSFYCDECLYSTCDLCFLDEKWCRDQSHEMGFQWSHRATQQSGSIRVSCEVRSSISSRSTAALLRRHHALTSSETKRLYEQTFRSRLSDHAFSVLAMTGKWVAEGDGVLPEDENTRAWLLYASSND